MPGKCECCGAPLPDYRLLCDRCRKDMERRIKGEERSAVNGEKVVEHLHG